MATKRNRLNLNKLQLKTLALLQELAKLPGHGTPADEPGAVMVANLPRPHGDHFHVGEYVVMSRDATGLGIEAAWRALERKGLARSMFPLSIVLSKEALDYDTGWRDKILHRVDH